MCTSIQRVMRLLILFGFVCSTKGLGLYACQDVGFLVDDPQVCQCPDNYFYNAYEGKCQDACTYYGSNICEYGPNASCSSVDGNPLLYTCNCSTGYQKQIDGSTNKTICTDINECETGEANCDEERNEVCVNSEGGFSCICDEESLSDEDGQCQIIDKCKREEGPPCDQQCSFDPENGVECSCFFGYTWNGENCELDDSYEECTCQPNPDWSICVMLQNSTKICTPKPGFEFNSTDEIEDINECLTGENECPRRSDCKNIIGWYECVCWNNHYWDPEIRECVPMECPDGFIVNDNECQELCKSTTSSNCSHKMVCLVDEKNIQSCECQVSCQMNARKTFVPSLRIYELVIVLTKNSSYLDDGTLSPNNIYEITKSIEMILGKGNVEIFQYDASEEELEISMVVAISKELSSVFTLSNFIQEICWPLMDSDSFSESVCLLPGGIEVVWDSIRVYYAVTCPILLNNCTEKNARCLGDFSPGIVVPGNSWCVCLDGYRRDPSTEEFYCIDINECNMNIIDCPMASYCENLPGSYECVTYSEELILLDSQISNTKLVIKNTEDEIEEEKKKTQIVGGVLGSLFGLGLLLTILIFYMY